MPRYHYVGFAARACELDTAHQKQDNKHNYNNTDQSSTIIHLFFLTGCSKRTRQRNYRPYVMPASTEYL